MNKKEIIIDIEKDKLEKEYKKKLLELSKSLKLKGFRQGNIPIHVIESRFGENIKQNITNDFLNDSFTNYIKKNQLNIVDYPKIKNISNVDKTFIKILLEFYILPNIDINLTDIKIKKYTVEITKEDIQNEIRLLRLKYGFLINIESESEYNDILEVSLYEKIDNDEKFLFKNKQIKLNDEEFYIKNFKQNLKNKKKNLEYNLYLKNNEIYNKKQIDSKEAYLLINKIERYHPCNIDDDFMLKIGLSKEDKNNLENIIKNKLLNLSNYLIKNITKNEMFNELINKHNFEIPEILIEKKINEKNINKPLDKIINEIKLNLIIFTIKEKFNIQILKNEIIEHAKTIYGKENIEHNEDILKNLENNMYIDKIIDIINNKINASEENLRLESLIEMSKKYDSNQF